MRFIGNILWMIFGGLESALAYFIASLVMALTIVGIPFAMQTLKIGVFTLIPFGSKVVPEPTVFKPLAIIMNIIWIIIAGFWISIMHLVFGVVLSITIIGLPFGIQHFKLAKIALVPFGKRILNKDLSYEQ